MNGLNKSFVQQLIFFVFGLQFLIAGMIRGNPQLLIFAGVNIVIMIWLFAGPSTQEESGIIGWIHYLFKHYLFVLTGIALIAGILNMIFPTGIEINISLVGLIFATSCCIVGRDLVKGEIYFGNKLIFPKDVVFRGSIMAGILVFQALGTLDIAFKTLAATISGFVLYVIFVKAMRLIKHVQLFKLKSTLFYSIAIVASSIWTIVTLININATVLTNSTTQWRSFVAENISQNTQNISTQINQQLQKFQSTPSISGLIVTGKNLIITGETLTGYGEVLTGLQEIIENTGNTITTGITVTGNILTGSSIVSGTQTAIENPYKGQKNLTYAQVLPYLLKSNAITLTSKKTVSFPSVSKTSSLYPVFATAYEKRMIGTATKPTTVVSCQTYMVLKGIAEGRNTAKRPQASVFDRYRAEAESLNKLNGCTRNAFINGENL